MVLAIALAVVAVLVLAGIYLSRPSKPRSAPPSRGRRKGDPQL